MGTGNSKRFISIILVLLVVGLVLHACSASPRSLVCYMWIVRAHLCARRFRWQLYEHSEDRHVQ